MEYDGGTLTEWYSNGPLGLQQGFTVAAAASQTERRATDAADGAGR